MVHFPYDGWKQEQIKLRCIKIRRETHNTKTFHFVPADIKSGRLFLHKPGQFITLRLGFDSQSIYRSYTISSSPTRPMVLCLTIKRDPDGLVSRYMHDFLQQGDIVQAAGPAGIFNLIDIAPRKNILMLSGGAGITPMMSMARYLSDQLIEDYKIKFIHSARDPDDIIFKDELLQLSQRDLFDLALLCDKGAEGPIIEGLLTRSLFEDLVAELHDCTVLCCGPASYMEAMKQILAELDFDFAHYHEESFGNPEERDDPAGAEPQTLYAAAETSVESRESRPEYNNRQEEPVLDETQIMKVKFAGSDQEVEYQSGETLLEIASRSGIAIPTNCQMGLCGTCKVLCKEGEVQMDEEEGLEEEEKRSGYVLACCGRPQGSVIVVEQE